MWGGGGGGGKILKSFKILHIFIYFNMVITLVILQAIMNAHILDKQAHKPKEARERITAQINTQHSQTQTEKTSHG